MDDDALRDSLLELYEYAPCGYLFTLPDGTINRVNRAFIDLTGHDRADLAPPRRFQDLLTVAGQLFYENQYAPLLLMQGRVNEVALDIVRKSGDRVPVLVNAVLRRDPSGQPIEIATTLFEATDRRRYEQELLSARRKAEDLAAVVIASGDAIVTVSPTGRLATWNLGAERLFGYPEQEVVGQSLRQLLPALFDPPEWERLLTELGAGRSVERETVGRRADQSSVSVSVGASPHLDVLGQLTAVSLIVRDISGRRELERQQQEFIAMANHELRTPVTIVRLQAQMLRRRQQYNESAITTIIQQADQLGRLVDDLLMVSQIEADRLELRVAEVELCGEVRMAAQFLEASGRSVLVEGATEPIMVQADRHRLGQVFSNLLTNAAKYSPEESQIVVRVWRGHGEAVVSVRDSGSGIPAEALPYVFDRFYRVTDTASRVPGVGVGLFITRRIVEAHRGRISVDSQLGHGSTFTVTLPLKT